MKHAIKRLLTTLLASVVIFTSGLSYSGSASVVLAAETTSVNTLKNLFPIGSVIYSDSFPGFLISFDNAASLAIKEGKNDVKFSITMSDNKSAQQSIPALRLLFGNIKLPSKVGDSTSVSSNIKGISKEQYQELVLKTGNKDLYNFCTILTGNDKSKLRGAFGSFISALSTYIQTTNEAGNTAGVSGYYSYQNQGAGAAAEVPASSNVPALSSVPMPIPQPNPSPVPIPVPEPDPEPYSNLYDRTIILFMDGTNLESDDKEGTKNLLDLLRAGIPDNIRVFVLCGGAKTWHMNDAEYYWEYSKNLLYPGKNTGDLDPDQKAAVDDMSKDLLSKYGADISATVSITDANPFVAGDSIEIAVSLFNDSSDKDKYVSLGTTCIYSGSKTTDGDTTSYEVSAFNDLWYTLNNQICSMYITKNNGNGSYEGYIPVCYWVDSRSASTLDQGDLTRDEYLKQAAKEGKVTAIYLNVTASKWGDNTIFEVTGYSELKDGSVGITSNDDTFLHYRFFELLGGADDMYSVTDTPTVSSLGTIYYDDTGVKIGTDYIKDFGSSYYLTDAFVVSHFLTDDNLGKDNGMDKYNVSKPDDAEYLTWEKSQQYAKDIRDKAANASTENADTDNSKVLSISATKSTVREGTVAAVPAKTPTSDGALAAEENGKIQQTAADDRTVQHASVDGENVQQTTTDTRVQQVPVEGETAQQTSAGNETVIGADASDDTADDNTSAAPSADTDAADNSSASEDTGSSEDAIPSDSPVDGDADAQDAT